MVWSTSCLKKAAACWDPQDLKDGMTENPTVGTLPPETQSVALRSALLTSQMGVLTGLFLFLYGRILASLVQEWWTQEESSHGFLVLPICFIILWANRRELKRLPIEPSRKAGILVMGAAALFLILGEVGGIFAVSQMSLMAMLAGLVLTLLGVRFLTALCFPLSYLLFMMPSLAGAVLAWNWEFQLATARMGVFFLQLLGIPAQLDENHIILPSIILRVASSCSGARYLISILALALPLGYLVLRRPKYRITLAVLALIIGITANWMRVVLIGLWAYSGGEVVHGPFHVFQALSVAWVAFAGLFIVTWALSRVESRGTGWVVKRDEGTQLATGRGHGFSPSWNYAWAQAALLLLASIAYLSLYYRGPVPLKQSFSAFPSNIGQWVESRENRDAPIIQAAGAEEELYRTYVGAGKRRLHLYVAYFEYQQQGKEAVGHLMTPFHQNAQTLSLGDTQSGAGVGWKFVTGEPRIGEVLFWYDINGRTISNNLKAKAATIWDALTRGRTNGALVMVYREGEQNTPQESDPELKSFVLDLLPVLRKYLP